MGWNDRFLVDLVESIKINVGDRNERQGLYDDLIALINNNDIDIDPASARGIDSTYDAAYKASNEEEIDEDITPYLDDEEEDTWDDQDRDTF